MSQTNVLAGFPFHRVHVNPIQCIHILVQRRRRDRASSWQDVNPLGGDLSSDRILWFQCMWDFDVLSLVNTLTVVMYDGCWFNWRFREPLKVSRCVCVSDAKKKGQA